MRWAGHFCCFGGTGHYFLFQFQFGGEFQSDHLSSSILESLEIQPIRSMCWKLTFRMLQQQTTNRQVGIFKFLVLYRSLFCLRKFYAMMNIPFDLKSWKLTFGLIPNLLKYSLLMTKPMRCIFSFFQNSIFQRELNLSCRLFKRLS